MRLPVCAAVTRLILLLLVVPTGVGSPAAAADDAVPVLDETPRTLVLALDGMPFRVVKRARADGAFEGWPEIRPLVSTFPSITNVAFTAILSPIGAEPVKGYEVRHFDPEQNRIHGGGFASKKKSFAWKDQFQVISRGNYDKARIYMTPKGKVMSEIDDVTEMVLESPSEFMLAHVAATDMLMHFTGEDGTEKIFLEIADRIDEMRRRYLKVYGRALRVILLSDHGNTSGKVQVVGGVRDALRESGLHPAKKLKEPQDVVVVSYGLVGYTVLFADPVHAESIAQATRRVEGVALSAWRSGDSEISVLSAEGRARVRWRTKPRGRRLAYEPLEGDPLGLREVHAAMRDDGLVDDQGYATRENWFERTASLHYPDGLARLVDSLSGAWVTHPATVILSMEPGYAIGVRSVKVGTWFRGGHLEGTHGALDRGSSWGFFLDSDPTRTYAPVLRADRALIEFAARGDAETAQRAAP